MIIEVYINYTKGIVKGSTPYGPNPWSQRRRMGSQEDTIFTVGESYSDLTPEEQKVLKTVQEYANEHGIEYKVHDISKTRESVRAFMKGVKESPTVVIGNRKFVSNITKDELKEALSNTT